MRRVRGWARTSGGLGGGLGYGCEGCEWGLVGRAVGGLEAGGGRVHGMQLGSYVASGGLIVVSPEAERESEMRSLQHPGLS